MGTEQVGGTYLYAVVPKASAPRELGELSGVEQGKVYTVDSGELAAVVSDVPSRKQMRPERRLLSAHQQVLKRVTDSSPAVLPVSFGTIADDAEGVRELLAQHQQELSAQMQRIEGKLETRVRISYATSKPDLFEFLVANSDELREARDLMAQSGREPTREDKIDLGQKVDSVLSGLRDECAQRVEQAIGELAESKRDPPRNDKELANLAFLVPTSSQAEFDAAAQDAARLFPDSFYFEQLGPYPPYDFVELHIKGSQSEA